MLNEKETAVCEGIKLALNLIPDITAELNSIAAVIQMYRDEVLSPTYNPNPNFFEKMITGLKKIGGVLVGILTAGMTYIVTSFVVAELIGLAGAALISKTLTILGGLIGGGMLAGLATIAIIGIIGGVTFSAVMAKMEADKEREIMNNIYHLSGTIEAFVKFAEYDTTVSANETISGVVKLLYLSDLSVDISNEIRKGNCGNLSKQQCVADGLTKLDHFNKVVGAISFDADSIQITEDVPQVVLRTLYFHYYGIRFLPKSTEINIDSLVRKIKSKYLVN